MDDINKFPRVGNASFYDFENSFVNVIFEAAPNPLRGSLDVCGFVTLTITDVFILILRHLWIPITTLLSFYFLYKKHAWVFEKWGSLVFWFKMIVNYTLLISFASIRANIALAFKSIARNTRADQKRTDKSPDKAAISSTNIPTTTFEELFGAKVEKSAPTGRLQSLPLQLYLYLRLTSSFPFSFPPSDRHFEGRQEEGRVDHSLGWQAWLQLRYKFKKNLSNYSFSCFFPFSFLSSFRLMNLFSSTQLSCLG